MLGRLLEHSSAMGTRRQARERAIQFLFQYDHNPTDALDAELEHFWLHQRPAVIELVEGRSAWGEDRQMPPLTVDDIKIKNFAEPLVRGVLKNRDSIDIKLSQLADNWDLHRMAAVDRNILRLAAHELMHREDIPPVVVINEAVDIAKKFSTDDSGKFVNGILDKLATQINRSPRIAKEAE